ncbi:MAG: hypothetical protein ABIN48_06110 [Ginsengibacter sp.]
MATKVNFKGRKVIEPGVYAQIKSGIPAKPNDFSFGDLAIIDTGSGKGFGGGSGINGVFANGLNSVYSFNDSDDFKNFVKGGLLYDLADYIFNPANNMPGPETVHIIRAAQTIPSTIFLDFNNGTDGGSITIKCKNEGSVGNGITDETLGKAVIRFDNVSVGNTVELKIDGLLIADYTCVGSSIIEAVVAVAELINNGNTGYTAGIEGQNLLVFSKLNSVDPSTEVFTLTGTVTFNGDAPSFVGWKNGTTLSKGYGWQFKESAENVGFYTLEILEGNFAGLTVNGKSINGLTKQQTKPSLLIRSPEFNNVDVLLNWLRNDFDFNSLFNISDYLINGNGDVSGLTLSTLMLASGGSEIYDPADLDRVLEDIRELDNTFFLSDKFGVDAKGIVNSKILNHIKNTAEFDKFLIIGGGSDETKFDTGADSSIEIAKFYDTTSVIICHDGETRHNQFDCSKEKLPSIYYAANVAGRLGGLEPQESGTYKTVKIKEFNHPLGLKQREKALIHGVVHNRNVPGIGNVINQAVNTIQNNTRLINPDGTSFEISIMRIGAQLNKELILNMRPLFVGSNWGKTSPADVKAFVEGYLLSKTSTNASDNLILSFKNVTVRLIEDYYDIKYGFVPNGPINKLFVTGFMLDANLSA